MVGTLDEMLDWADEIVIAQKPSAEIAAKLQTAGKPVLDLVRCGVGTAV